MSARRLEGEGWTNQETLVLTLNQRAMQIAKTGDYSSALGLLQQAEELLYERQFIWKLQAITFNNFGNVYRKSGEAHLALHYLQQALDLQLAHKTDNISISSTRLSLCAAYSMIGRHRPALSQAVKALELLRKHFDKSPSLVTTLGIAYHNAGVEQEHLHQRVAAAQTYSDGWHFAKLHLGGSHPLTTSLKRSFYACADQHPVVEPRLNATFSRISTMIHPPQETFPRIRRGSSHSIDLSMTDRKDKPRLYSGEKSRLAAIARTELPVEQQRPISRYINSIGQKLGQLSTKLAHFAHTSKAVKGEITKPVSVTPWSDTGASSKEDAVVKIQRFVRGFTARRKTHRLRAVNPRTSTRSWSRD